MNYITTPIYYASGDPHLGHAYSTLLADARRRYGKICGAPSRLLTGTDEHGQKIAGVAERESIPVQDFVNRRSDVFLKLWDDLEIDCEFVRTTNQNHVAFVQICWQRLIEKGDLYAGEYTGEYCVECEQFLNGIEVCPIHNIPLDTVSEKGYFFRLSKYQDALLEHLTQHPEFITPKSRYEEALAFVTGQPLQDLCVSRGSTSWGIKVPDDPDQVVYVWLDALLSYVSVLNPTWQEGTWDVQSTSVFAEAEHFIGKDILTFHAVYWPAILLALDLPLPTALRVNGWLTVEGQKIAKSNPATIVNPLRLAEQYSLDGLRYYLLSCTVGGQDINFSEQQLASAVNNVLANSVGNLIGRCAGLLSRNWPDGVHKPVEEPEFALAVLAKRDQAFAGIDDLFNSGDVSRACRVCFEFAGTLNTFFQNNAPWHKQGKEQAASLWWFHGFLQDLTILLSVFTPQLSQRGRRVLNLEEPALIENRFDPGEERRRLADKTGPLVTKV